MTDFKTRCPSCGAQLTEDDFVPCAEDTDCPLLELFDRAMARALQRHGLSDQEKA